MEELEKTPDVMISFQLAQLSNSPHDDFMLRYGIVKSILFNIYGEENLITIGNKIIVKSHRRR